MKDIGVGVPIMKVKKKMNRFKRIGGPSLTTKSSLNMNRNNIARGSLILTYNICR